MSQSILKLVTFDVTGTLMALKGTVGQQYAKVGLVHGISAPHDVLTKQFFVVFKELLVDHPNFGVYDIGWQEWWEKLVSKTFFNSLPDQTLIEQSTMKKISSDLIEIYKTTNCWQLAKGAKQLLDQLSSKNIPLGVISNYDPRLEDILVNLDIRKYFDFVLTSYSAKCQKPDAAIFQMVEDLNKNVSKHEILHIGDNPQLDFFGAKNMGWNALLIAQEIKEVHNTFPCIEKEWTVGNVSEIYGALEMKRLIL